MTTQTEVTTLPRAFIWRRLHSLFGLWIVLFLIEHLLTNSQAALLLGENGKGFVRMVNALHNLPYLQAIEIFLLGVPLAVHAIWGIKYLLTAKSNSTPQKEGSKVSLPEYGRNHAYTWQRITSWILLVGIVGHVVKFRFLEYPTVLHEGTKTSYFVRVSIDNGLYTVAERLGTTLYDHKAIEQERKKLQNRCSEKTLVKAAEQIQQEEESREPYDSQKEVILTSAQKYKEREAWVNTLEKQKLENNQVIAIAPNFGTATLLSVRDTFKNPLYVGLYTIFVLAAVFHAFNGFWTFLITWGFILKMSSQRYMVKVAYGIMFLIGALGLVSIWGTYFLNLRN